MNSIKLHQKSIENLDYVKAYLESDIASSPNQCVIRLEAVIKELKESKLYIEGE